MALTDPAVPSFRVTPGFWRSLPAMEDCAGDGYIADVYENPEGSSMCSGYFELKHSDEPLFYEYTYDEMKIVLEGEFTFENVDTGQVEVARAKDAIFFPAGSRINFTTPDYALAFYAGTRKADAL